MIQTVIGKSPFYTFEADPFVIKKKNLYFLYNHDIFGIKEYISHDGLNFKFIKYIVKGAIRPFIVKDILYYEKITDYIHFPFFKTHIRSRNLLTNVDIAIVDNDYNNSCPSIINSHLFYSTTYKKMDHGWCEPTYLKILNGPKLIGLDNISSLRQFGSRFLGTLIEIKNGISYAKIVNCHPISFPNIWQIGSDFLTADDISPSATHVYIPAIIDDKLYFNVRFGRKYYSSEKILTKSL